jgi:hypothetical protein
LPAATLNWPAFVSVIVALFALLVSAFLQTVYLKRSSEVLCELWWPDDQAKQDSGTRLMIDQLRKDADRVQIVVAVATLLPGVLFVAELAGEMRIVLGLIFALIIVLVAAWPQHSVRELKSDLEDEVSDSVLESSDSSKPNFFKLAFNKLTLILAAIILGIAILSLFVPPTVTETPCNDNASSSNCR